ncbi:ATP-binding protein [Actinoplanes flavus]|uniref:AAA family ATPase n=1 Tax=Actinoplanes flavus TaxID=2820290 RepID=A0ABS3UUK4_9ACTN|nr:LuxR family transcriptional regulator [Actinoplanes flavus]MBO3742249.1 AAA family ATPase [Actinoplanes flavus]
MLFERDRELAAIADHLADCARGHGSVLLVEAVAGQGKTAVVAAALDQATSSGVRVLSVRACHLEAATPFDLMRRLLGPLVDGLGGPDRLRGAGAFAQPLFVPGAPLVPGVDYGCQALLAARSADSPLLVAVDDAHWADPDSLRVLADLAEDLRDEPIMLMIAARPGASRVAQPLLARLAISESSTVLRLTPLTECGVHAVLRAAFRQEPDPALTRVCADASGGNAFYLREMIRPLLAAGAAPDCTASGQIESDGPASLARTVRVRLAELGTDGTRLAYAAATLGDEAALEHTADVAGLTRDAAGYEAARLVAAAILASAEPVVFPHPLVRAAVEHTAEPGVIAALHARAVDVLRAAGAPVRHLVQHLLEAPPTASAQVCRLLLSEACNDLQVGSAVVAHRLLRRALAEPPPAELRPVVLLELARAERAVGDLRPAREHLTTVVESAPRALAVAAIWELLEVLFALDDPAAVVLLHRTAVAAEPYGDTPEEVRLRALLLGHAATGLLADPPQRLVQLELDRLPVRTAEDRLLLVCAAVHRRAARESPADDHVRHLRRAVTDLATDRPLTDREVLAALEAAAYLAADEAMDEADEILRQLQPHVARLRGMAPELQAEWNNRIILNAVRRGRFEEATALLAGADDFAERHHLAVYTSMGHYARGCIALDRGAYPEAGSLLLRGPRGHGTFAALGELLSGRPAAALALLAEAGHAAEPDAPIHDAEILFEPHLVASHAYSALDQPVLARAEAERELAVRRLHGPPFRLALALRRRARFLPAREALALHAEAAEVCAVTARLPVLARVKAGHGAALRRCSRLVEARAELSSALDLADRMGLTRLREQVTQELRLAGGRVRRARTTGAEALTAMQRKAAELAAQGLSNRQIADELYLTVKTVESHLNAAFRKLAIAGRDALRDALDS